MPGTIKYDKYYLLVLIFITTGLYFYLFGNHIFFYQENLALFVFSCDYLKQFTSKPGGLLEYAGNFLSQGYFSSLYGALILAAVFTTIAIVFLKINKRLSAGHSFSLFFATLVSCILILIQTNINYLILNNLGFMLSGLYFLVSVSSGKRISGIIFLVLFPVFYYMTGAYAMIYLGMLVFYRFLRKEIIYALVLLIVAGLTLLLSKAVLFLQPWSELLYYPLPPKDYFNNPVILLLLYLFFVFYPVLVNLTGLIKVRDNHIRSMSIYPALFLLFLTIFLLSRFYSRDMASLFRLEKMFFAGNWNGVIKYQESHRSGSLVAQYYYNTALSENGMLCDRMFLAPQTNGTNSIMIPWNSQISISRMFRGVYFYYSIGLINEAHRWAYESMVIQGYRPENIKLLIKTNLINGHFKIAEKYISVLKKSFHYRDLATKYEAMTVNPELIRSDPELGEKIKLKPKDDFLIRIRNPEKNILNLLQSNPGNRKALEYELACLMLEGNVEGVVNDIDKFASMGYSKLPRHIEEAAILYQAKTGMFINLNGLKISNETDSRFLKYESAIRLLSKTRSIENSGIPDELRNTFWFYLDVK